MGQDSFILPSNPPAVGTANLSRYTVSIHAKCGRAMLAHPILINRLIVVAPLGVRLCRPSEAVLDILPDPQRGAFAKEDSERVVDAAGRRTPRGSIA
jgi:hypothetical protein